MSINMVNVYEKENLKNSENEM